MQLKLAAEDEAFRLEVTEALFQLVPSEVRRKLEADEPLSRSELADWHVALDNRGWAAPSWPVEWGGAGWTPLRQHLFAEAVQLAPAPELHVQSVNLVGPLLIAAGSVEQRQRFLPRIRRLETMFCQGFSEPDAGSDLASLRTRAVRDGGSYVVSGQKIWTTDAHRSDWMFCLARTSASEKKQSGLSYLLIDMRLPGVTVRPINSIDGRHTLNEVFLDDVRVPADCLVGEENRGWEYTRLLLARERTSIARVGVSKRSILRAKRALAKPESLGLSKLAAEAFSRRVVLLEVQLKALEMMSWRLISALGTDGGEDAIAPSILKMRGAELQQMTAELLLDMAGSRGWDAPARREEPAWLDGGTARYLHLRAATIYGGSNEIQHNLLARALLNR